MNQRRNPDRTRELLLQAAFEEIHRQGFRGASVDDILKRTQVTKGALYYHFPSKQALGYAVVDEVVQPIARRAWEQLLDESSDPIDALVDFGRERLLGTAPHLEHGCPVGNLVLEMAGRDQGFRERLAAIISTWRETIATALARGQRMGLVRDNVEPAPTAAFIVAAYEGSLGLAKCAHEGDVVDQCVHGIFAYLESLRASPRPVAGSNPEARPE